MLKIRTSCENCDKELPNTSSDAMICTYECTFCKKCIDEVLFNVCPNCGGGFEKRPIRPKSSLKKNPVQRDKVFKPVLENTFLKKFKNVKPRER